MGNRRINRRKQQTTKQKKLRHNCPITPFYTRQTKPQTANQVLLVPLDG